jgi:two-component system, chemotaxis family, chemotaxis protein CheY
MFKALVIDDSRAMRTLIGRALKSSGFEIIEARTGKEALQRLSGGERPDLVVVDWNMPEMNGLDFVRSVRGRPELDAIRIMMVTAETEAKRIAEARAQGVDQYLLKPFTKDRFLEKLEQLKIR